ncbi:MAG: GlcG/HbpS family heme-binding protein [Candidatus Eiseniibacteriota bacterium]
MTKLTLDQANTIIATALKHAASVGLRPLTVAVLDDGGHLVAFQRQDKSPIMRPQVAMGKAWGAVGMGRSSRGLGAIAAERPAFMNALVSVSEGRLVPVPGGVLILDKDGATLGAVGISGDTSDKDEEAAVAGIKAAGLVPGLD